MPAFLPEGGLSHWNNKWPCVDTLAMAIDLCLCRCILSSAPAPSGRSVTVTPLALRDTDAENAHKGSTDSISSDCEP